MLSPIARFVLYLLRAAQNLNSESILSLLKTELFAISNEELSLLEEYVYIWGINSEAWTEEWNMNPMGFSSVRDSEKDLITQKLGELNEIRKRIIVPILSLKKAFSGNLTVSLREPLEGLEIEPTAVVLDAYSDAVVKNVEESGDKLVLVGELCLNILTNCENEYSLKEIKSPFKYEVEGGNGALFYTDCSAVALIPKAKIESGKLSCDCEVHISGRSYSKDEFSAVNEVIFGERVTRDGAITVCFPSPTDTLWDISKRYHIPTESIVSQDSRLKSGEAIVF